MRLSLGVLPILIAASMVGAATTTTAPTYDPAEFATFGLDLSRVPSDWVRVREGVCNSICRWAIDNHDDALKPVHLEIVYESLRGRTLRQCADDVARELKLDVIAGGVPPVDGKPALLLYRATAPPRAQEMYLMVQRGAAAVGIMAHPDSRGGPLPKDQMQALASAVKFVPPTSPVAGDDVRLRTTTLKLDFRIVEIGLVPAMRVGEVRDGRAFGRVPFEIRLTDFRGSDRDPRPLIILMVGALPPGDTLRHVADALGDKLAMKFQELSGDSRRLLSSPFHGPPAPANVLSETEKYRRGALVQLEDATLLNLMFIFNEMPDAELAKCEKIAEAIVRSVREVPSTGTESAEQVVK